MPPLPPHIMYRKRSVATRLPSPLVLSGYHPDFTSNVYNRDSENSMSDDVSLQYNTPESSASVDIPLSSRSASSLGFNSTGFLQDKYTALLHTNQKLETDNLFLKGQIDALQDAYSRLLATIRPAGDVSMDENHPKTTLGLSAVPVKQETPMPILSALPEAEREDFPLIKYWSRHEWSASDDSQVASIGAPGKARAAQGENVSLKFIEDENGNTIDGYRATAIRKFARSLWVGLSNAGKAPKSWGKVDAETSSQFQIEMCRKFPELRLCEGNWKVDLIATMNYPSWYSNQAKEKEENRKRASAGPLPDLKRPKPALDYQVKEKEENRKRASAGPLPDSKRPKLALDSSNAVHTLSKTKEPFAASDRPLPAQVTVKATNARTTSRVKNPLSAVASPAACANDHSIGYDSPTTIREMSLDAQADTTSGTLHVDSVVPMEDVPVTTLSLADPSAVSTAMISGMDHPSTLCVASSSLVDPSLANDASITTVSNVTDHSAPPIGVAPSSLVDPSLVNNASTTVSNATDHSASLPSFVTEVNSTTDHSATSLSNVAHINGDPNVQLSMMSTMVTLSTVMSNMSGNEPIPVCNASTVSHASLKPSPCPLVMGLGNPAALTTGMLVDAAANAPSNTPSEKGSTGLTKKAGAVMRPNPQSKTARNLCALAWKERNPQGLTMEFKQYFDSLSPSEIQYWKDREAALKMATGSSTAA